MPDTAHAQELKAAARKAIDAHAPELIRLSHEIHAHPELAFEEVRAQGWLSEALADAGLQVETGTGGVSTAFRAQASGGPFRVAVCAEYDALPGIGHACGHNMIAASAVGTAIGLVKMVDLLGLDLHVIGTPAEENGGGKILLLEAGAFDGVHAAIMVHPAPLDLLEPTVIGVDWIEVQYEGKAAHASASPELGVNAADAVVLAHTAIGLLRQHIDASSRVHGIIRRAGDAPNIIPAFAEAEYMVRGTNLEDMAHLRNRVEDCFRGAALATGCTLTIKPARRPYAPMRHDARLTALYRANAESMGRRFLDAEEVGRRWAASTDMGNVSQQIPSAQPLIGIDSSPATNHQPEFAAAAAAPTADQAVIDGAIAMASTIIDVATNTNLREELMSGR